MPSTEVPGRALVLGGVDRAAFVAALATALRAAGVPVTMTAMTAFAEALGAAPPVTLERLSWLARITLVDRREHLAIFDRVFDAAFRDAVLPFDPHARRRPDDVDPLPDDLFDAADVGAGDDVAALPWHTLPQTSATLAPAPEGSQVLPELLPSAVARIADTPLDELDTDQLDLLARWLEDSAHRWPRRRSRRWQVGRSGRGVALRETIAASRRTGWETVELQRRRPVHRPLTVTLLVDVSQSMQSWSAAYLHLMRAFARTRRAETFAFSTSLTRLTPALAHHSPQVAVALAGDQVVDRFGGTHLASCLGELLASRQGSALRGGVLVIASDGWDSDEPAELAAAMVRARRRARRIVWLNPRAAAAGFEPLVGSMAAALPYCDAFLPADRLAALPAVFDAISSRA